MYQDVTNNYDGVSRHIESTVNILRDYDIVYQLSNIDDLKSWTINKVSESGKFFGFGVCQKLLLNIRDKDKQYTDLQKGDMVQVMASTGGVLTSAALPYFYIQDIKIDENTNDIEITAFDFLYQANTDTIDKLSGILDVSIDIRDYASGIAYYYMSGVRFVHNDKYWSDEVLTDPNILNALNLEGTEKVREVLDDIAEATQTIYYVGNNNILYFKKLSIEEAPVLTIDKANYFTLKSANTKKLTKLCNATELGDNVTYDSGIDGDIQYIRNNAFWELRTDIDVQLEEAYNRAGGIEITPYSCEWRGNFNLEIGDKIGIIDKENNTIITYFLNDSLKYTGGLHQSSSWDWITTTETDSNPSSLGEALKKTYARVDKAEATVDIVTGDVTSLKLSTEGITSSVKKLDSELNQVISQVESKVTAEDVTFSIQSAMNEGVNNVTTTTGYTLNSDGLKISKSDSDLSTEITDNGMKIYQQNNEVLIVDNEGVKAEDLHATTFLIIGNTSRLENYGSNRTGCFWIK